MPLIALAMREANAVIGLVREPRREAAEQLGVCADSAVDRCNRWNPNRPEPRGWGISPLAEHSELILALIAEQSHLTLDEIISADRNPIEKENEKMRGPG
jgi:hypothetical protein